MLKKSTIEPAIKIAALRSLSSHNDDHCAIMPMEANISIFMSPNIKTPLLGRVNFEPLLTMSYFLGNPKK